ncbi:AzlC family ABC transporter permease [Thermoflavimicrobium daqui]|uniref:Branched-chain amino acid ABC transporter permease n=1 Tax=Thermoflavimicrobium daqui TaxID=2137476 RepID=A0A364K3S8_9BACL|nr:AzlC family ABC transporter permease [Thermoflavimicrobium daqui]RAL24030.1 branched-chain amino acid ABC transporter permease [Thermoflavimicrobium daqui]
MSKVYLQTNAIGAKISFLQGVKDCIPTVLGYFSIGIAAGVVQKTAGFTILEITLISLLLYAGSAQFIVAGMYTAGASISAIIFTIFLVNLRHLLMSAALSSYFRHLPFWKNVLIGSQLTDESFAVASNELSNKSKVNEYWMFGLNFTAYINWCLANVVGGILGDWIPQPEKFGLDFALPAMFIGLFVLQILSRRKFSLDTLVTISSVVVAIGASYFFSDSTSVMIATIIAATIGMWIEKWR